MKKLFIIAVAIALITCSGFGAVAAKTPAQQPDIVMGCFIHTSQSAQSWLPSEDSDKYKWAPKVSWASEDLPLEITIYTKDEPASDTFAAIVAGFTEWDDITSASIYGSITENTADDLPDYKVIDESNSVGWGFIDGPEGILGVTYYWFNRATKEMLEFDIVLDSSENWSTTGSPGTFDVQSIATHEAGHTLVLGDIYSPRDTALTMYGYASTGDIDKRNLATGDKLGLWAIYGS